MRRTTAGDGGKVEVMCACRHSSRPIRRGAIVSILRQGSVTLTVPDKKMRVFLGSTLVNLVVRSVTQVSRDYLC